MFSEPNSTSLSTIPPCSGKRQNEGDFRRRKDQKQTEVFSLYCGSNASHLLTFDSVHCRSLFLKKNNNPNAAYLALVIVMFVVLISFSVS